MSHPENDGARVDAGSFRALMSTFPSGVAVVTGADGAGTPFGLTCSSLCSVSLEPPLLLVCVHSGSHTLSTIRRTGAFGVNFLHRGGREAAELFSSRVTDRFERIAWRPTTDRALPCLPAHASAVAECRVAGCVPGGDHTVLIGEVATIVPLSPAPPLLYGLRQYAEWPASWGQSPVPAGSHGALR